MSFIFRSPFSWAKVGFVLSIWAVGALIPSPVVADDPLEMIGEAEALLEGNDLDRAFPIFLKLSGEDTQPEIRAYSLLGMERCCADLGLNALAKSAYDDLISLIGSGKATRLDRESLVGMGSFLMGEVMARSRRWGEAADMFSRAFSVFGSYVREGRSRWGFDSRKLMIYLAIRDGGYPDALEHAFVISGERAADCLVLEGRYEDAKAILSRILSHPLSFHTDLGSIGKKLLWLRIHRSGSHPTRLLMLISASIAAFLGIWLIRLGSPLALTRSVALFGILAWQVGEFLRTRDPNPFSSPKWWWLVIPGLLISGMVGMRISVLAIEDREKRAFPKWRGPMSSLVIPIAIITGLWAGIEDPSSSIFLLAPPISADLIAHRIMVVGIIVVLLIWIFSILRARFGEEELPWILWFFMVSISLTILPIFGLGRSPSLAYAITGVSGIALSIAVYFGMTGAATVFSAIPRFYLYLIPLSIGILLSLLSWDWVTEGVQPTSHGMLLGLIALSFILGALFHPLSDWFGRTVRKATGAEGRRHRIALIDFGRRAIGQISVEEIGRRLLIAASYLIGTDRGVFLHLDPSGRRFVPTALLGDVERAKRMVISANDDLIHWMRNIETPLILSRFLREFPATRLERSPTLRMMSFLDLEIALPIPGLLGERDPSGILMVGRAKSGEMPSEEDLDELVLLALQGSIAMENARLYGDVMDAKRRLEDTLESLLEGIVIIGRDGRIIGVNRMAEKLLGSTSNLLAGRTAGQIGLETVSPPGISESLGIDGMVIRAMEDRSGFEGVKVGIKGKDVLFNANISPIIDSSGKIEGALLALEDVTRKEQLERELRRAEKLSTLGRISYALVHEIRNPLFAIRAAAQHLRSRTHMDEELDEFTSIALEEVDRVNKFIENFLAYARPRSPRPKPFDLVGAVEMALMVYRQRMEDSMIRINRIYPERHPWAFADPDQVRQALLNVVLNAIQAMEEKGGGIITVSAMDEGAMCRISVRDTGVGIPDEEMGKIFEPFYTTKEGGIGIGLAIVREIVEENGGEVRVESRAGEGTEFHIWLPGLGHEGGDANDMEDLDRR